MSNSINKVILVGRLCKEPIIRTTQQGKEIATLSIATNDVWKDKSGERKEKAEYHNVVIFNEGLVRIAKSYLKKGSQVYIEGEIRTRKWQDKSGKDNYTTEIVLQGYNATLQLLDSKPVSANNAPTQNSANPHMQSNDVEGEEIPF